MLEQVVPVEDYQSGLSLMEGCSLVLEHTTVTLGRAMYVLLVVTLVDCQPVSHLKSSLLHRSVVYLRHCERRDTALCSKSM